MTDSGVGVYRENILDHYKNPRNFGEMDRPDAELKESNPLCGDEIKIQVKIMEGKVADFKFTGKGCAISMASASMLSEVVKGMDVEEIKKMTNNDVVRMLSIPIGPVRIKCATLPLIALKKVIDHVGGGDNV